MFDAVSAGMVSAGFTVTTKFEESAVTGVVAESVIPIQYEFVVVGSTSMPLDVDERPEYVASTFALSSAQVFPDGPVYHFIVYGAVPPDHEDDRVTAWPKSTIPLDVPMVDVSAGFTIMLDVPERTVCGEYAESVTDEQ